MKTSAPASATSAPKQTIRPIGNYVVIQKLEETYAGKILLPDSAKNKVPVKGRVLGKGDGDPESKNDAKIGTLTALESIEVGDIVLFPPFAGTDVELDGFKYVVIPAGDILGVVEDAG